MAKNNYTLGRGQLYLSELDGDQNPGSQRYVGNSVDFNINVETETLDHTDPDQGVNQIDASVQTSVTRTGTLTLDDIQRENLALFFFGTEQSSAQSADSSNQTFTIPAAHIADLIKRVENDAWYQIGVSASNPSGIRGLGEIASVGSLTVDTDYEVDLPRGRIRLKDTTAVKALTGSLTVTYKRAERTLNQVISGSSPKQVMLKFFEDNPEGEDRTWTLPVVALSPSGEMALKGAEWRQIPFSLSIQVPATPGVAAIYIDDKPVE